MPVPVQEIMAYIQFYKFLTAQSLLHSRHTTPEMPPVSRIRVIPIARIDSDNPQKGMHHLMYQHRPHVPQPRRRQLQDLVVKLNGNSARFEAGCARDARRVWRPAAPWAISPGEVDVLGQLPGEEHGVDIIKHLEHNIFPEMVRRVLQILQAFESFLFPRVPGPAVEFLKAAGGTADG